MDGTGNQSNHYPQEILAKRNHKIEQINVANENLC
jgi:hypothetical protein